MRFRLFYKCAVKPKFNIVDLEDLRGINCRFGMMGNTANTLYASRNFTVVLVG